MRDSGDTLSAIFPCGTLAPAHGREVWARIEYYDIVSHRQACKRDRRSSLGPPGGTAYDSGTVGMNVGGRRCRVACSNAYASAISRASLQAGPMNEMPTGSPLTSPTGTVILG